MLKQHFLLSPQFLAGLFLKKTLNLSPKKALVFTYLLQKSIENTFKKGEIACNEFSKTLPFRFELTLSQMTNLRLFKLKDLIFADDSSKFHNILFEISPNG